MKRAINTVGWIIIFITAITSIFYYRYGKQNSFLRADMRFFNITKEDIICSMQQVLEEDYITSYTEYYFRKEANRNEYYNKGDAEKLTKIFLDIENTKFHYSLSKIHSYSLGGIDLEIPVTTLGKSYIYILSGYRTGIGKCMFYNIKINDPNKDINIVDSCGIETFANALFYYGGYREKPYSAFEGITIKNGPEILKGTYYRKGNKKDYITIKDKVRAIWEDNEETYYISIHYKDKEKQKNYIIFDYPLDPSFCEFGAIYEIINDHTLKRQEAVFILNR